MRRCFIFPSATESSTTAPASERTRQEDEGGREEGMGERRAPWVVVL